MCEAHTGQAVLTPIEVLVVGHADRLDTLTAGLRKDLRAAGLDAVRAAAPAHGDAKSDVAVALGALTVTLGPAAEFLPAVLDTVRSWIGGSHDRKVTVSMDGDTIELSAASPEQQDRLVTAFLAAHGPKAQPTV